MDYQKAIKVNLALILIMAISGLYFGLVTNSKSLITDGTVSLVIFISSSLGLYVHSQLKPSNLKLYPYGKWRFEYIYNLFRLLTLLAIIVYSFFEAINIIYLYLTTGTSPDLILLKDIWVYFLIKLTAVIVSIMWLRSCNKRQILNDEAYLLEYSSVKVDGLLTIAILLGLVVFNKIEIISEIADACTLLIIAIILAISIFSELRHLIYIMIGRRMFPEEEQAIKDLIELKFSHIHVHDLYIEKQGIVTMIYIHCSFDLKMSSNELVDVEYEIKNLLNILNYEKPKLHFYFVK